VLNRSGISRYTAAGGTGRVEGLKPPLFTVGFPLKRSFDSSRQGPRDSRMSSFLYTRFRQSKFFGFFSLPINGSLYGSCHLGIIPYWGDYITTENSQDGNRNGIDIPR
jgi:hypothetical protein